MNCADARLLFLFAHKPGELAAEDALALAGHLRDCPQCQTQLERERREDAVIARAMNAVPLPVDLQQRISTELRRRTRLRRRWRTAVVAAAAALLLAVGLGSYLAVTWPAALSFTDVRDEMRQKWSRNPDTIIAWYADRGVAVELPSELNYHLVRMFDFAEFRGVRVPHILLVDDTGRSQAFLHLFVLSDRQFDLTDLAGSIGRDYAGNFTVEVIGKSDNFRYVCAYTSGDLSPFRKRIGGA